MLRSARRARLEAWAPYETAARRGLPRVRPRVRTG
jgi:hypothetical protein